MEQKTSTFVCLIFVHQIGIQIMKKRLLLFMLLIVAETGFAQVNLLWQGYFSYNNIKDLSESSSTVFAASENALFSKNILSGQIKTTNTIDGLSGQSISSIYYSSKSNKTLIGYENGLMIVVNESDGKMLNVVDIISKQLPANLKKINHFLELDGIVYVSCDFGIVQFNLETLQFGDTYFIGDNGAEKSVTQTAIFGGFIYAATNNGIRRASVTGKNLNDFNQWTLISSGSWSGIETFDTVLIAINTAGNIHKYDINTNSFINTIALSQAATDLRATTTYLIVTTSTAIFIYNNQMALVRQINASQIPEANPSFSCATIIGDTVFMGTKENGLITTTISGASEFTNTSPNGPSRNNVFAIQTTSDALWTVFGDFDNSYNPYPLDYFGISKYSASGWLTIPYETVLGAKSLSQITINPNNEQEVYISSFYSGLLKLENDIPTLLYNSKNTGANGLSTITGQVPDDVRINGATFDKSGNLWMSNSRVKNGLKVLKTDNQWQSFSMDKILISPENTSFGRMIIDKNGTKWMATNRDGVVGFNENGTIFKKITAGIDTGNLPIEDVRAVAVDNRNQLWIGTTKGLRVLSNVGNFQTENQLSTNAIIISENNLAQELLYEQFITDIVVDGSNNKWIGTVDSGLFLLSPNGQETKYHFTINNSPLPSNSINDIDINSVTGEVFIATAKGLVSFKGTATAASEDLSEVYVYPNPVRPEYTGTVKINGLLNKANVKITDITGNLVYETTSEGGTIEWDTTAFGNYKVASGVYMIFISAEDGIETKVKKLMIVR